MQNQWHFTGLFLDLSQNVQTQTSPVFWIYAVDVADTSSQHINAQLADACAFVWISDFAAAEYAIFFAADCAYLSFNRDAFCMSQSNDFFCFFNIFFNAVFGTIEHNGGETFFDAFFCTFIGTMVQMQSNWNSDVQLFEHTVNHADNSADTAHVFACAFGYTQDNRGVVFLCSQQDCFCPFEIVDVKVTYRIFAGFCFVQHLFCRN